MTGAAKILYRPFSILCGVLGGVIAGQLFKRLWALASGDGEAPSATLADRSWSEVLLAAALEGAIYALCKAAVDRAGALVFESATGVWPGETSNDGDTSRAA